jgi:hypothetical protein
LSTPTVQNRQQRLRESRRRHPLPPSGCATGSMRHRMLNVADADRNGFKETAELSGM